MFCVCWCANSKPSPAGGYIVSGIPFGHGLKGQVILNSPVQLKGLVEVPLSAIVDVKEHVDAPAGDGDGDRAARQGNLPWEIGALASGGALAFSTVHVAEKVGAPFIGQALASASNVGSDPVLVEATTQVVAKELSAMPGWLGDTLKLLIVIGTLFGVGFKLLEFFFGKTRPTWAIVLMCVINFGLIGWAAMGIFELGPYAPPPSVEGG